MATPTTVEPTLPIGAAEDRQGQERFSLDEDVRELAEQLCTELAVLARSDGPDFRDAAQLLELECVKVRAATSDQKLRVEALKEVLVAACGALRSDDAAPLMTLFCLRGEATTYGQRLSRIDRFNPRPPNWSKSSLIRSSSEPALKRNIAGLARIIADWEIEQRSPSPEQEELLLSWDAFENLGARVAARLENHTPRVERIFAISRGGLPLATLLSHRIPCQAVTPVSVWKHETNSARVGRSPELEGIAWLPTHEDLNCVLLADDIIGTGDTVRRVADEVRAHYSNPDLCIMYAALFLDSRVLDGHRDQLLSPVVFGAELDNERFWMVFPWEDQRQRSKRWWHLLPAAELH